MEFVLVGSLLTALTLAVVQVGLAVYVRNVVHDAAVEGAYHAALADVDVSAGAERTQEIIARTIGAGFADEVTATRSDGTSGAQVEVTVVATMPLIGLLGLPRGWEVTAHAPMESLPD